MGCGGTATSDALNASCVNAPSIMCNVRVHESHANQFDVCMSVEKHDNCMRVSMHVIERW